MSFVRTQNAAEAKSQLRRARKNIAKAVAERADAAAGRYDVGVKIADARIAELEAAAKHFTREISRHAGKLEGGPPGWWKRPPPRPPTVCYRTKTDALNAFADHNRHTIERWGGMSIESSQEFDAINHRLGLKGNKRVKTIADALWAVLPTPPRGKGQEARRPYCLENLDLQLLNETSPAEERPFELPDVVLDKQGREAEAEHYRDQAPEEQPFDLFGRAGRRGIHAAPRASLAGAAILGAFILGMGALALAGRRRV